MATQDIPATPTALVVLDTQNAMVDIAHDSERVLDAIAGLLSEARRSGAEVVFVQHDHDDYGPMTPGHEGWRLHASVRPRDGETVVHKRGADCFDNPSLDARLRERGVRGLVLAGMATEHCIEAASRTAQDRGYTLTLASDGHTTARDDDVLIEMGLDSRGGAEAAGIIADHNARWARSAHVRPAADITFAQAG